VAVTESEALPLLDKPSIAVLPFDNMSGDPEQEYFADGITEDVITELSRFRALTVIARNTTFTYKGQSVNVQKIGRELNVRYVVEGSVRKAANRVRITVQLLEAETGSHLWAERYDRDLEDIFAVQDEITLSVVSAIAPGVLVAENASARRKAPESLSAWECVVRGTSHMWNVTREEFEAAATLFDQAIGLDPNYASAHSYKAYLKVWNAFQGWGGRISDELSQALDSAQRALELDKGDAMAYYAVGFVNMFGRRSELAIDAQRAAVELNPNSADAHFGLGMALAYGGEVEAALEALDTSRRLNPRGLFDPMLTAFQALAHFRARRDVEAARLAARSIDERPDFVVSHLVRAAALGHLDRVEEAHDTAAEVMRMYPNFSLAKHERLIPIADAEDRAHYLEGLHKAGLPE
jgi:TolB-like protein